MDKISPFTYDYRIFMVALSLFYFFCFGSIGISIVFLPKELMSSYSILEIGIIFSIIPITRFITPFISKKYISLTKNIFKISLVVYLLSSIMFSLLIYDLLFAILFSFISGISFSFILSYVETMAILRLGKEKYGYSRLFGSIGFMITILLLPYYLNTMNEILFTFILLIFISIVSAFFIEEESSYLESNKNNKEFHLRDFTYIWLALFFMQFSFGGFYNFFTIYELEKGLNINTITLLFAFGVLCEIMVFLFQKQILSTNTLIFFIKISIFFTIIRWLLVHFYGENINIMYLASSLHSFSFALFHSSIAIHLFQIYKQNQLSQQFLGGIGYGIGAFSGAIVAGLMYGDYLFLFESFLAFIAFIFIILHEKDFRKSINK